MKKNLQDDPKKWRGYFKASDYESLKKDIDLLEISSLKFYIKKLEALSASTYEHQKKLKKDATKMLKIIREIYPEYFI